MGDLKRGKAQNYGDVGETISVNDGEQTYEATAGNSINSSDVVFVPGGQVLSSGSAVGNNSTRRIKRIKRKKRVVEVARQIKVLFYEIDGTDYTFSVGGDRKTPKVVTTAEIDEGNLDIFDSAKLTNTGKKLEDYCVFIKYFDFGIEAYFPPEYIQFDPTAGVLPSVNGAYTIIYADDSTTKLWGDGTVDEPRILIENIEYKGFEYAAFNGRVWIDELEIMGSQGVGDTTDTTLWFPWSLATPPPVTNTDANFYLPSDLETNPSTVMATIADPSEVFSFVYDPDTFLHATARAWHDGFATSGDFRDAVDTPTLGGFDITEYRAKYLSDPTAYNIVMKDLPSEGIDIDPDNPTNIFLFIDDLYVTSTFRPTHEVDVTYTQSAWAEINSLGLASTDPFKESRNHTMVIQQGLTAPFATSQYGLTIIQTEDLDAPQPVVTKSDFDYNPVLATGSEANFSIFFNQFFAGQTTASRIGYIIKSSISDTIDFRDQTIACKYDKIEQRDLTLFSDFQSFTYPFMKLNGEDSYIVATFTETKFRNDNASFAYQYAETYTLYTSTTSIVITNLGPLADTEEINGEDVDILDVDPAYDLLKGRKIYRVEQDAELTGLKSGDKTLNVSVYTISETGVITKTESLKVKAFGLSTSGEITSANYYPG